MTEQHFSLIPFSNTNIPAIQISGYVSRQSGQLNVQYVLSGDVDKILLPERSTSPGRKGELWDATCFEFFLARPGDPQYWEFNVAPTGDWNAYYMDAYRQVGFREEPSIEWLSVDTRHAPGHFRMTAAVNLGPLAADGCPLELGICCVIESVDQFQTYWALAHPKAEPDFHRRESFILHL